MRGLGTGHVMSGPMRGFKINRMERGHTDIRLDKHVNYMTDPTQRAESVNVNIFVL